MGPPPLKEYMETYTEYCMLVILENVTVLRIMLV